MPDKEDQELKSPVIIREANIDDVRFASIIADEMESSAKARGTGIAKRKPSYISQKMEEGKAIIALTEKGEWVGFCYIEVWGHQQFVANSGLIVSPPYRNSGVAKQIKRKIFELSGKRYPETKIFGLTTGHAVMKMNSELGYVPVPYSELTDDEEFWAGCKSCVNYEILMSKNRKNCLCTGMLYDPKKKLSPDALKTDASKTPAPEKPVQPEQAPTFANRLFKKISSYFYDDKKSSSRF